MKSRKVMAAKNVFSAVLYYVVNSIIGFASRKVFVVYLGSELLGLNGLIASVISMLSLLELGVASSIGYSLYRPLQEEKYGEVKAIMLLFAKLYRYIGLGVLVIGAVLIPFLPYFVETSIAQDYVVKVYLIFLADAVLSYLMAYRRTILVSDQKDYINKNADTLLYTITGIMQIAIICIWQNYLLSLIVKLAFTVINNVYLYYKAGKIYPYLNDVQLNEELDENVKKEIVHNVKAVFVIRVASYCVLGTDNILLSAFVDLTAVAIYSGYTLIIGIVNNLFNKSLGYITANIGNYLIGNDKETIYKFFKKMNFMNYLVISYTSVAMFTLFNEFIGKVWLEEDYVFPLALVALLVFNNYFRYMTQCAESFRSAAGLYSPRPFIKYVALLEGAVNLAVSVVLAHFCKMGIYGIFLGTTVSTIVSTVTVVWIIYKYLFEKPSITFYTSFLFYTVVMVLCSGGSYVLFQLCLTSYPILNIVIGGVISLLIPIMVNWIIFGRTEEWKYGAGLVTDVIQKVTKK